MESVIPFENVYAICPCMPLPKRFSSFACSAS
jgi:hypothetical protein